MDDLKFCCDCDHGIYRYRQDDWVCDNKALVSDDDTFRCRPGEQGYGFYEDGISKCSYWNYNGQCEGYTLKRLGWIRKCIRRIRWMTRKE
ncbi:hypothetical protein LCGC14_2150010 [marine sediment metagenome]|uniref:Uncharacterized protein n=1 Tax=marine sediment metagenome TaxID=412755 RepID=A0A0F9EI37_9ZZZZ